MQLTAGAGAQSKHMAEAGVKPRAAGTVVSQEVAAAAVAGGPSSISSAAHPPAAAVGSSTAAGAAKDASASGGDGKTNCFSGSLSPVAAKLSQFKVGEEIGLSAEAYAMTPYRHGPRVRAQCRRRTLQAEFVL